jgi:hypothetical protein
MPCERCKLEPNYHSFQLLADISGIHYFYCFPAHNKQSVRTREDMLNFVSHFPSDKPWSLVFHANGYGLATMMPISIALEMGKIVQENHRDTLQKVFVIEGSWFFQFLLKCIFPFLSLQMREKFVLVNGSLLEVITELRGLGFTIQQLEPLRSRFG